MFCLVICITVCIPSYPGSFIYFGKDVKIICHPFPPWQYSLSVNYEIAIKNPFNSESRSKLLAQCISRSKCTFSRINGETTFCILIRMQACLLGKKNMHTCGGFALFFTFKCIICVYVSALKYCFWFDLTA